MSEIEIRNNGGHIYSEIDGLPPWIYHSYGVAEKMYKLAKEDGLPEEDCQDMWLVGFLHDCSKRFCGQDDHERYCGEFMERNGFHFSNVIRHHGTVPDDDTPYPLVLLRKADLSVDWKGRDVGYDERLKDIIRRHGVESESYKISKNAINALKNTKRRNAMFKILLVIAALIVLAILFIFIFKGKNLAGSDSSMSNDNNQLNWDLWQKEQDEQNWANWQQQQDQQNWNDWDE